MNKVQALSTAGLIIALNTSFNINATAQDDASNDVPSNEQGASAFVCLAGRFQASVERGLLSLGADKVFALFAEDKQSYEYVVFPVEPACYDKSAPS